METLIALSARERSKFLDADTEQRLRELLPQAVWLSDLEPGEPWHEALRACNPQLVLGCWDMPALDKTALLYCPNLRYLCYLTGSVRGKIDRDFLQEGGIVTNWGATISRTVAECALMLALACLRQLTRFSFELHFERSWEGHGSPLPRSLFERSVGIHGFGNVARQLLPLLAPFGCRVQAWSEPVPDAVFLAHSVEKAASLEALFADNDIVIEAEALTPESRGSVNWAVLQGMKAGAVLVNVARAAIIEEFALIRLAQQGQVQIGLDVFHAEPLPADYPLRGLRNVTMVPHIGGPTADRYRDCTLHAINNITRFIEQKQPEGNFTVEVFDLSPEFF